METKDANALTHTMALVETVQIALQTLPDPAIESLAKCLGMAHTNLLDMHRREVVDNLQSGDVNQ